MYLSEIYYEPVVIVRGNGIHYPMLLIQDMGVPKILEMLGADEMQNIDVVKRTIEKLEDVEREDEYYINRKCYYLKIVQERVWFFQESASEDFIEMDLSTLIDLLKRWKNFLTDYNSKKIKGLIYPA